jgi:integral membrane protein (TIGR01906 family)
VSAPRAPGAVGLLFGVALAVAITLTGPLLLFNPWFTSALQARHEVAAAFGTTRAEVDRVTGEILVDLYVNGTFDAALDPGEPLLDARERSHMGDVARLVQLLAAVAVVAIVLVLVMGAWLRGERRRQGRIMLVSAGVVGAIGLLLAGIFAVAFEPAFLAFHAIFFPPGTYLFEEGSNLIVLFPEPFWFDAALVAGASVVLTALAVSVIGLIRWRGGPDDAGASLI